jgi:hypothetical protein
MTQNPITTATLIRNKLASMDESTIQWFHEKGIMVSGDGNGVFFLKADVGAHTSELTTICGKGLVYSVPHLVIFSGTKPAKLTLEEAKVLPWFIWNDKVMFFQHIPGQPVYMGWDPIKKDWLFSDDKSYTTPYESIIKDSLYNRQAAEYNFTFCFKLAVNGHIFLESVYNNKTCRSIPLDQTQFYAYKFKIEYPNMYAFEGFEKLEEGDFPLIARDMSENMIHLTSMK